ncbi:MAG: methyltransferase domain-containing protein [Gaiellales bacterium]
MVDFDPLAPHYDRLRTAGGADLSDLTLEQLAGCHRLLDVGCGTGRFAVLASQRLGARVWGIDASPGMLAQARARPGARAVGWRQARAEQLPFRDGWFDAAHAHLVLHLVDDRTAALAELARVLAPGGRAVILTFELDHFDGFFLNPYFPSIRDIDRARFPDPEALVEGLREAGFAAAGGRRISMPVAARASDVVDRVRGRYISTLHLLDPGEYRDGLARPEADVAGGVEEFRYTLEWCMVTARR